MKLPIAANRTTREDVLSDPRNSVSRIADQLRPYLTVLTEQFHPEQIILFGSHAYGKPDRHSDIDLLIIMPYSGSALREKIRIREAWRTMPDRGLLPPFDLILVTPEEHKERLKNAAGFYDSIVHNGLPLL